MNETVIPSGEQGVRPPHALHEAMRAAAEQRGRDALIQLGYVLAAIERGASSDLLEAMREEETSAAQLVGLFADLQLDAGHASDALRSVERALGEEAFTQNEIETLRLRRRAGELGLRAGAIEAATQHLNDAREHALRLSAPGSAVDQMTRQDAAGTLPHILLLSADAQLRAGDTARASADAQEAQERFEQLTQSRLAGRAAFLRAMAAQHADDADGRLGALQDAERIFRHGGELDGLGTALGFLGEADAHRGDLEGAIGKFQQAREVLEQAGEFERASIAMDNTAVCLDRLGRQEAAVEARNTARQLLRQGQSGAAD